jgi:hypothetical protein
MADQSMRVTNWPDSGSAERVAYDLMVRIAASENSYGKPSGPNPRAYYLGLYAESMDVIRGVDPK